MREINGRIDALRRHLDSGTPTAHFQPCAAAVPTVASGSGAGAESTISESSEPYRFCPPYDYAAMLEYYNKEGFVLVSGLIPAAACEAAVAAMWRALAQPGELLPSPSFTRTLGFISLRPGQVRQDGVDGARERAPIDQHDKSTWPLGRQQHQFTDPAVEALWNPDYLRLAEFLSNGYDILEGSPGRDMAEIRPPTKGATIGAINVFPEQKTEWSMPSGHLDHCIPRDGFLTFPRPVRMSTMTYLLRCIAFESNDDHF